MPLNTVSSISNRYHGLLVGQPNSSYDILLKRKLIHLVNTDMPQASLVKEHSDSQPCRRDAFWYFSQVDRIQQPMGT